MISKTINTIGRNKKINPITDTTTSKTRFDARYVLLFLPISAPKQELFRVAVCIWVTSPRFFFYISLLRFAESYHEKLRRSFEIWAYKAIIFHNTQYTTK